jgi:DNA-directed RNA polymerase specialized sigma24 family protein
VTDAEFDGLYRRYGYFVHVRCRALLRNEAEAEDAVQEVFFRALQHLPPADFDRALGWLYATATHYCQDVARRQQRRARSLALSPPGEAVCEGPPGLPVDARHTLRLLVGDLDAETFEIGVLHLLDGFTQEEVAERTGFSRRTVGKRLKRIEQRVQERLGQKETQP